MSRFQLLRPVCPSLHLISFLPNYLLALIGSTCVSPSLYKKVGGPLYFKQSHIDLRRPLSSVIFWTAFVPWSDPAPTCSSRTEILFALLFCGSCGLPRTLLPPHSTGPVWEPDISQTYFLVCFLPELLTVVLLLYNLDYGFLSQDFIVFRLIFVVLLHTLF